MPASSRIDAPGLPDGTKPEMNFLESSYFKASGGHRCLPSPTEVLALSGTNQDTPQPGPVIFEDLNLIVKFGAHVTVAEAQCLWVIRKVIGDEIPVPEVYGWRVDGRHVFIYMELIRGETLHEQWASLNTADKTTVCDQLQQMVTSLRQVEQDPDDTFIGGIDRRHLLDIVFEDKPQSAPFATVKEFNDWFSGLSWLPFPVEENFQDPWRAFLPDMGTIKLTHGDLHRGNIIVSTTKPPRILAIVDWAHCGWYPDYWEYCKAAFTCSYDGEWRKIWIPKFLDPCVEVHEIFAEYTHAMGAF